MTSARLLQNNSNCNVCTENLRGSMFLAWAVASGPGLMKSSCKRKMGQTRSSRGVALLVLGAAASGGALKALALHALPGGVE